MSRFTVRYNSKPPEGAVYCNFKTGKAKAALPDAAAVPTIVSGGVMAALMQNDGNSPPVFKTEAIDFPVKSSGGIYTKSFFKSFLSRMAAHPFGGNKLGHGYPERNDFYTVGGMIEEDPADKNAGTVYFKIYVPSEGYETANSGFIRDLNAGNVHFSLVTLPEFELRKNSETGETERYFTGSTGMERNDAVPFEGGAMPQQVNEKDCRYEEAKSLILAGKVNYTDTIQGDGFIYNGIVYRSVLRRTASRADGYDPEVKELLSLIDRQKNKAGKQMEILKEDAVKSLRGYYLNGLVTLEEIAEGIGSTAPSQIRNEQDRKNEVLANQFYEKLGAYPLEEIDKLLADRSEAERRSIERCVSDEVGPARIRNGSGVEIDNPCYAYAMNVCRGKTGKELNKALESLKTDSVMVLLRESQADMNSGYNRIVPGGAGFRNSGCDTEIMEV